METSKEGTKLALDPKIQELYARLEEEKEKNRKLREENIRLTRANAIDEKASQQKDTQRAIINTKKKMALQEQLNEKKLQAEIISNQQQRIDSLADTLTDNQDIQELDSKSISELKAALDSLIAGREKRKEVIRKLSEKNRVLMDENADLKFTRTKLAHDLRSLMSSILGTLSLVDMGETEALETLVPLLKDRCYVFINLLSAINDDAINKESISISDVIKLLNLTVPDSESQIKTEVLGDDVHFTADKAGLYDVIQNLINNSVKYSGQDIGELLIRISVTQNENKTTITIADNGKGIASHNQAKVFDLYNRGDLTDKNGRGLGLFMVQKMIAKHEGFIEYDTDYKNGAQFNIVLPNL